MAPFPIKLPSLYQSHEKKRKYDLFHEYLQRGKIGGYEHDSTFQL